MSVQTIFIVLEGMGYGPVLDLVKEQLFLLLCMGFFKESLYGGPFYSKIAIQRLFNHSKSLAPGQLLIFIKIYFNKDLYIFILSFLNKNRNHIYSQTNLNLYYIFVSLFSIKVVTFMYILRNIENILNGYIAKFIFLWSKRVLKQIYIQKKWFFIHFFTILFSIYLVFWFFHYFHSIIGYKVRPHQLTPL